MVAAHAARLARDKHTAQRRVAKLAIVIKRALRTTDGRWATHVVKETVGRKLTPNGANVRLITNLLTALSCGVAPPAVGTIAVGTALGPALTGRADERRLAVVVEIAAPKKPLTLGLGLPETAAEGGCQQHPSDVASTALHDTREGFMVTPPVASDAPGK